MKIDIHMQILTSTENIYIIFPRFQYHGNIHDLSKFDIILI